METINDIVREMRKDMPRVVDSKIILRNYADRIEAAWQAERERVAEDVRIMGVAIKMTGCESVANCNDLGNTSKMREALKQCVEFMSSAICDQIFHSDVIYLTGCMQHCIDAMKDALSAPVRNCDRFSDGVDARDAWIDWEARNGGDPWQGRPKRNFFDWLFDEAKDSSNK